MTTLRAKAPLAGCIALSTYIPGNKHEGEVREVKIDVPVLHCHGELDDMVPYDRGEKTGKIISAIVRDYRFHSFPDMMHESTEEEMELVKLFIEERLPQL
jgi:predicted esterase